ncbi:hypothetical protein [Nocardia fluminea]|uniref:Uncharacterized protein n=1 Tax=Nocardia fluminea TaxID=134984 RepID=A0A2N3V560_9NOCA|nr:hypothetical protein [Nocardia fluminea]PKV76731.1 hypothetical protein ATK86_7133 [Nocardia fluminea]
MEDEHLMSAVQQRLVLAVVDALNNAADFYTAVCAAITPPPASADVDTVLRILALAPIAYKHGERPAAVLARILTAIEIHSEGGELVPHRPVARIEDRY